MLQGRNGVYRQGAGRKKRSRRKLADPNWDELLVSAYEIGLTTEQFWRSRPVDFERMIEGYQRRNRAAGVYFREIWTLVYNVNRGEKTPYLEPQDVLKLPGDKPRRKPRGSAGTAWSDEAIAEAIKKHSTPPPLPETEANELWPEP